MTRITAFCPECNGRRTFNLTDGLHVRACVVCGGIVYSDPVPLGPAPSTVAREAVVAMDDALLHLDRAIVAVHRAARDDRETLGELAGGIVRLDDELGEIRDAVLALSRNVQRIGAELERLHPANGGREAA